MEKVGVEVSFNRNLQFMMDQRLAGGGNGENSRAEGAQPKAFFGLHFLKGETGLTGRSLHPSCCRFKRTNNTAHLA